MIDSLLHYSHTGDIAASAVITAAADKSTATSSILMSFILIVIGLAVFIGLIFLQIFLSKAKRKWPGLVLPGYNIVLSIIADLGLLYMTTAGTSIFIGIIAIFVVFNIPTLVYLAIYKVVRSNRKDSPKNNQEITRMNIQDL